MYLYSKLLSCGLYSKKKKCYNDFLYSSSILPNHHILCSFKFAKRFSWEINWYFFVYLSCFSSWCLLKGWCLVAFYFLIFCFIFSLVTLTTTSSAIFLLVIFLVYHSLDFSQKPFCNDKIFFMFLSFYLFLLCDIC